MRLLYLIIPSLIDHLSLLVNGNHRRRMKKMPHPYYKTTFRCDCGHFDKKFVVRMTIIIYCDNCAKALLKFANIIKHIESKKGALAIRPGAVPLPPTIIKAHMLPPRWQLWQRPPKSVGQRSSPTRGPVGRPGLELSTLIACRKVFILPSACLL